MSRITKQDTNGVKPLLAIGELGYDNYPTGGDVGRVYVGTGTENIALAKKTEVIGVDGKADAHIARVDNPHNVTKAQVGLANVDNTSDAAKNVLSATKLTTPRNISLTGDVTGSVSFDGTGNVSINSTVVDDSHNHVISNIGGLQTALNLKANSASPTFTGIATGTFSGSLSGNATTATTLQTARTINGVSFNGSANITIPAGATGAGSDKIFFENGQTITTSYSITSGMNAMTAGPITINNDVTITIPDGSSWTIV